MKYSENRNDILYGTNKFRNFYTKNIDLHKYMELVNEADDKENIYSMIYIFNSMNT